MKTKNLILTVLMGVFVMFSCQKDPQREAEKAAKKEQRQADRQQEMVDDNYGNVEKHSEKALKYQTQADISKAIASVNVPDFDNVNASEFVKKVGNHITALTKSENYENAGKYIDALNADVEQLQRDVENGSLSANDAERIGIYVENLADALGIGPDVYEVDIEVEADN